MANTNKTMMDDDDFDFEMKDKPAYAMPGRPPKNPKHLVRLPVRALTTIGVRKALEQGMELHGITLSNYLRLALYEKLKHDGLLTKGLQKDATWDELRYAGLV